MALIWLLILWTAEGMSLVPDPSPCLFEIEGYKSAYYQQNEKGCAPFHIVATWSIDGLGGSFKENNAAIQAYAALVVAIFTVTLWQSTEKMWVASANQLSHAERTAERQLRAYVSVETRGINPYGGNETEFLGHVGILNNGQTPARNISHTIKITWLKEGGWVPPPVGIETRTDTVLQPRAEMRAGSGAQSVAVIETAKGETSYIYLWGRVEYEDGVSNAKHFTNFCHRYNCAVFDKKDRLIPLANGRYHEHGNSAD